MKKLLLVAVLVSFAVLGMSSQAGATVTYTLGLGNPAIAGLPGTYAVANLILINTTLALLTCVAGKDPVGGHAYLFGDGGSVAYNVNANGISVSVDPGSVVNVYGGFSPGPVTFQGLQNEDGFGHFNQTWDSFDGYTNTFTYMSF